MGDDRVRVQVDPGSSWFAEGSEQWHREQQDLRSDLQRELDFGAVEEGTPTPGDKGVPVIPIIVALGGAHAFQAMARCFDSWLRRRPGERSLTVTRMEDGKEVVSIHVDAKNLSDEVLKPLLEGLGQSFKKA
jgi:Effector Associated Constant Component 1